MRKNSRKNKMNTAKIGVIFIVVAMALAGVGAGYSAWFDTITIQGTVSTGSVEWHFIDYSGTYVWKIWDLGYEGPWSPNYGTEIYVTDDPTYHPTQYGATTGFERVAYAEAVEGLDDHYAIVTYDNLFPSIDFEADVVIEYDGTVPGKINSITFTDPWPDTDDEELIDCYTDLYIDIYDGEDLIVENIDLALLMGYQLHYGYEIHVVMKIHLPQDDTLMSLSGSFNCDVEVIQWNEYVPPQPPVADGNTLITEYDEGRVFEVDSMGIPTGWEVTGLNHPHDAERLADGNTLIAECHSGRVFEVDSMGIPTGWEVITGLNYYPVDAERLADGNTLITEYGNGRVFEVDNSGTIVWEKAGLNNAWDAERLANGNTLITEYGNDRVIEVDNSGTIVWEKTGLNGPCDAERI